MFIEFLDKIETVFEIIFVIKKQIKMVKSNFFSNFEVFLFDVNFSLLNSIWSFYDK